MAQRTVFASVAAMMEGSLRHVLHELCQCISLRHLPLCLSCGAADREPHPLRSRALYVEERFLADAAHGAAPPRIEPVPLWGDRRHPRSFRRLPGASLGDRLGT